VVWGSTGPEELRVWEKSPVAGRMYLADGEHANPGYGILLGAFETLARPFESDRGAPRRPLVPRLLTALNPDVRTLIARKRPEKRESNNERNRYSEVV